MATITGNIDLTEYEQLTELAAIVARNATFADPKPKAMRTTGDVKRVIRERMKERGLTLSQLAQQSGASMATVSKLLDKGYSTYREAKPVFGTLHVDPFLLPPEFAMADLMETEVQS